MTRKSVSAASILLRYLTLERRNVIKRAHMHRGDWLFRGLDILRYFRLYVTFLRSLFFTSLPSKLQSREARNVSHLSAASLTLRCSFESIANFICIHNALKSPSCEIRFLGGGILKWKLIRRNVRAEKCKAYHATIRTARFSTNPYSTRYISICLSADRAQSWR